MKSHFYFFKILRRSTAIVESCRAGPGPAYHQLSSAQLFLVAMSGESQIHRATDEAASTGRVTGRYSTSALVTKKWGGEMNYGVLVWLAALGIVGYAGHYAGE